MSIEFGGVPLDEPEGFGGVPVDEPEGFGGIALDDLGGEPVEAEPEFKDPQIFRGRGRGPAPVRSPEEIEKAKRYEEVFRTVDGQVKNFDEQFSFTERLGIRLGKGHTRRTANGLLRGLTNLREELRKVQANDADAMRRAGIVMPLEGGDNFTESTEAARLRRIEELQSRIEQMDNEYLSVFNAVHNPHYGIENPREVPEHPAMLAAQVAQQGGDDELVNKLLFRYFPEIAAETMLPSITQAGPAQLVVPGGGAAITRLAGGSQALARGAFVVGTGSVSGHVESQAAFAEFLQEQGVDMTDLNEVAFALDDPELVKKARDRASKRGLSVAMWDMLGAYIAAKPSKFLVPPGLKNKLARQLMNAAVQLTGQVGTGAAGEATAQFAAGQDFNALEVKLEALGEIPTAVSEPIVFHIADKIGKKPSDLKTVGDVLDAFIKNPEITEGEALAALKEVAARGMTDEEAINMLKAVPGFTWSDDVISEILDENASRVATLDGFQNDENTRTVVQDTFFENQSGGVMQGLDIINNQEPHDGTVWWTTDQQANRDTSLGVEVTSGQTVLRFIDESIQQYEAELNVLQAQQAPQTALNERINHIETLRERRARVARDMQDMARVRPLVQQWLQEMVNTFTPNQDVMVIEDNTIMDFSHPGMLGSAGSVIGPTGRRTQVITLNTRTLLDWQVARHTHQKKGRGQTALVTVLAHEYGHAIMQSYKNNLPPEAIAALKAEHRMWLAEQLKDLDKPFSEFLGGKKNPFEVKTVFGNIDNAMNDRLVDNPSLPYHLSLDEFIADRMARQISDPNTTTVPPMLRKVLPRMETLLRRYFQRNKPAMEEGATYEKFLQFIKARAQRQAMQRIEESFTESERNLPTDSAGSVVMSMLADKNLNVPSEIQDEVFNSLDTYNKLMRYGLSLLQLGRENKHIVGLQRYIKAVHEHWVTKSNWNDQAMQTMNAWRRLGRKTSDELGRFLLELTVRSDDLQRALTDAEIQQLMKEKKIDFGQKGEEAFQVYKRIKGDLANALEQLYVIEKNRINQDWAEVETQRKAKINELDELFTQLRNRDYFPLSRFGEWGIAMKAIEPVEINGRKYKTGETVHMELYENKRQRNRGSGTLRRKYGRKVRETFFKVDESLKPFTGLPMAVMRQLKQNPKLSLTPEQKQQLQDMIDTMSPTQSIAKRMLQRKGTAGFSMDAQRGYANYMLMMGGHISKMLHAGEMDAAIDSVKKSARYLGERGLVNDKRHEIAAHLERHQDYLLRPENEWGALRALAFHWFLGYNPKSAIVNLTQVPLVAYPYLAARRELTGGTPLASDAVAIKELTAAMKDVGNFFKRGINKYSIDEQAMLSRLQSEGIIDESLATELAGQAHGDLISTMMPKETAFTDNVHFRAQQFLRGSTWMFQAAEKFNRRVTALATYRLARNKGMDVQRSIDEAREALRVTQFEYARWNRAAFMRGKAGVFFVFMQYLQNVLYFVTRDPGKTRYMLMMFMAAGLQGLPGAEDLMDLFDFGSREMKKWLKIKTDPRSDIREDLRRMTMSLGASPELMMHGLSAQSFGLGLPAVNDMLGTSIPSLTFENSISAGRVIPGWEALLNPNRMSGVGAVEGAKDVLGAAITVPLNILRWTRDQDPSEIRAFERMAPSVLKGAARAYRIANEGGLYDRGGRLIADFDMSDPEHIGELIGMSLGAQPTRVQRIQEARWAEREATEFYSQLRQNLLTDFFYAMEERNLVGDVEAVQRARDAITDFNRVVPKGQQIINLGSSYANFKKRQALDKAGIGQRKLDLPLQREIRETFPSATEERIQ